MPEPLKSFEGRQDLYEMVVDGTSLTGIIIVARWLIAEVWTREKRLNQSFRELPIISCIQRWQDCCSTPGNLRTTKSKSPATGWLKRRAVHHVLNFSKDGHMIHFVLTTVKLLTSIVSVSPFVSPFSSPFLILVISVRVWDSCTQIPYSTKFWREKTLANS